MANRFYTFILFIAISTFAVAQGPGNGFRPNYPQQDGKQKIEFSYEQFVKDLKDFITREAQLTPAEATKFFPLLLEMHEKKQALDGKRRELMMSGYKGGDNMSDAEYSKIIDQVTKLEVEIKQVEQTYYKKFHSVISWKKVFKVRAAIDRYHMYALRKFHPGPGKGMGPRDGQNRQPQR